MVGRGRDLPVDRTSRYHIRIHYASHTLIDKTKVLVLSPCTKDLFDAGSTLSRLKFESRKSQVITMYYMSPGPKDASSASG